MTLEADLSKPDGTIIKAFIPVQKCEVLVKLNARDLAIEFLNFFNKRIDEYTENGSGFTLVRILKLYVTFVECEMDFFGSEAKNFVDNLPKTYTRSIRGRGVKIINVIPDVASDSIEVCLYDVILLKMYIERNAIPREGFKNVHILKSNILKNTTERILKKTHLGTFVFDLCFIRILFVLYLFPTCMYL